MEGLALLEGTCPGGTQPQARRALLAVPPMTTPHACSRGAIQAITPCRLAIGLIGQSVCPTAPTPAYRGERRSRGIKRPVGQPFPFREGSAGRTRAHCTYPVRLNPRFLAGGRGAVIAGGDTGAFLDTGFWGCGAINISAWMGSAASGRFLYVQSSLEGLSGGWVLGWLLSGGVGKGSVRPCGTSARQENLVATGCSVRFL